MQRQGHQRGKVADMIARGVRRARVGGVTGGKGGGRVYCDPAAAWKKVCVCVWGLDDMNNTTQTANRKCFFLRNILTPTPAEQQTEMVGGRQTEVKTKEISRHFCMNFP